MLVGSKKVYKAISIKHGFGIDLSYNLVNIYYKLESIIIPYEDKVNREKLYSAIIRDYENGKKYFDLDEYFNKTGEN